jgi:hypothetical protein
MTGHVLSQLHCVFDDAFLTIDNIFLPGQMTETSHWKDLCHSSTNYHINERHNIGSLCPTFNPKDLFNNYYQSSPAMSSKNSAVVTFADPVAIIASLEGAPVQNGWV